MSFPGVIIRETNVATAVAETNKTLYDVVDEDFYEDEYSIRLSRAPANGTTVEIDVTSIAVAADKKGSMFTPIYRNTSERVQVEINGSVTTKLVFTSDNWSDEVLLRITAIDDEYEEGVDWLNFASQPSTLVRIFCCFTLILLFAFSFNIANLQLSGRLFTAQGLIQGPIFISGGDSPYVPPLGNPLMLPNETNPDEFIVPPDADFSLLEEGFSNSLVLEENQVDTVIFNNYFN